MRQALAAKPGLEKAKRLQAVLAEVERTKFEPEEPRRVRAVQVLELVGTESAGELLRDMGRGVSHAPHQDAARGALRRLERRR